MGHYVVAKLEEGKKHQEKWEKKNEGKGYGERDEKDEVETCKLRVKRIGRASWKTKTEDEEEDGEEAMVELQS